jgi:hypothetical protein
MILGLCDTIKTNMKRLLLVLGVVLLITSGAIGTFFATRHYTFKSAYATGHKAGQDVGFKSGYKKGYDSGWDKGKNAKDFQPVYPIPNTTPTNQSIHCTSSNFGGSTTYTDCN